jgi:hypothetical protein
MAAVYQQCIAASGENVSSLSANLLLTTGTNNVYIAIVKTYATSGTPRGVTSIVRSGQSFTEATDMRQNLTTSMVRFPNVNIFIYYLAAPATAGSIPCITTLDGSATYAEVVYYELTGAYQGAPVDIGVGYGSGVLGSVGASVTTYDTQTDSKMVGHISMFKTANGGNGFAEINIVNYSVVASGSGLLGSPTYWIAGYSGHGAPSDLETTQGIGWREIATLLDIAADYVFVNVEVQDSSWSPVVGGVDSATLCEYVSGGEVRKMVSSVTGLTHLEGETIKVQMDGNVPKDNSFLVTSGAITLPSPAAVVHAGLGYDGTIRLLKTSDGSPYGTGQTKMRRVYLAVLRLYKTLGLKIGIDEDNLDPIFDEDQTDLFTGDQDKLPNTTWSKEVEVVIKQDKPLPAYILAAVSKSEVEEKL